MKSIVGKRELKGRMPHYTVRLPKETIEALSAESRACGRTIQETLRIVANRHVTRAQDERPTLEKLSDIHHSIVELGKDLETVTRMLLVALKIATDEEARAWTSKNLRVGP
jgi:hypothetical protein